MRVNRRVAFGPGAATWAKLLLNRRMEGGGVGHLDAEPRKMLWGMHMAPRMPMALNSCPELVRI